MNKISIIFNNVDNIIAIKLLLLIPIAIIIFYKIYQLYEEDQATEKGVKRTFKQQDWKVNRRRAKHIVEKRKSGKNGL